MIDKIIQQDISKEVDKLGDEMVKVISDIIKIPSINPYIEPEYKDERIGGETKVNEHLKPVMDGAGLTTDLWEVEQGRANLVGVCKGTGGGQSLIVGAPRGNDVGVAFHDERFLFTPKVKSLIQSSRTPRRRNSRNSSKRLSRFRSRKPSSPPMQ